MTSMPKILVGRRGRDFALIVLTLLGQALAAGAAAFATRDLFSSLASGAASADLRALMVLAISGFIIAAMRLAGRLLGERMGQSYAYDIRRALYSHTSRMARQVVANRRAGAISLRFVGDLTALRSWASLGLPQLVAAFILIPVTLTVLFLIEPEFGLYTLPLFVIAIMIMALLGRSLPDVNRRLRSARWRLAADMSERMPNAPYFETIGRTGRELELIRKRTDKLITASMHRVRAAEYVRLVPEILAGLAAALVIWLGFRAGLPTGSVAGALAALGLGLQPLRDLGLVWNRHSAWAAAHEKCVRALAQETMPEALDQAASLPKNLSGVSVTYALISDSEEVLARADAGSKVAFIGPDSAAKSKLLALLAGHEPDLAHLVEINGTCLNEYGPRQRARLITLITNEDPLLKGSLRRALTLGLRKRPADGDIIKVAERIGLGPVLAQLDGLDGRISEGARNLSPLARARILAARAMLSRTPLLLLDGLVEVLDADSQKVFFDWVLKSRATVFVTANNRASVARLDTVWDMFDDDG